MDEKTLRIIIRAEKYLRDLYKNMMINDVDMMLDPCVLEGENLSPEDIADELKSVIP